MDLTVFFICRLNYSAAHDFPKRPMLRSYPLSWTAVKCTGAGAANLGTRAC